MRRRILVLERSFFVALASMGLVGCTMLLGFDKSVESADGPLQSNSPDGSVAPGNPSNDASPGEDASSPEEDSGTPVEVEPYLEPTFGGAATGKLTVPGVMLNPGGSVRCAAAIAADRSIWIMCSGGSSASDSGARLYRIESDGTLDTNVAGAEEKTRSYVALFPQGDAVYLAGSRRDTSTNVLARYTQSGTLDPTFGTGGIITRTFPSQTYSYFSGGAFENATSLRLWGSTFAPGGGFYNVFATTFDTSTSAFGAALAQSAFPGSSSSDPCLAPVGVTSIDSSTLEFFGIYGPIVSGSVRSYGFFRTKNGAPDTTFGTNGLVTASYDATQTVSRAGAVVGDKIVIASSRYEYDMTVLARFSLAGAPDVTFGTNGFMPLVAPPATGMTDVLVRAILPLADGKFLIGGSAIVGDTKSRIFLARFDADGKLDTSFAEAGYALPKIRAVPTKEHAFALALESDGHVIVVGEAQNSSGAYDIFALRLKP